MRKIGSLRRSGGATGRSHPVMSDRQWEGQAMRVTRAGVLLVGAVLIAGCATGKVSYVKAGVSEAERKRDENECVRASLEHTYRAHILVPIAIDREAFATCLESRGYRATRE